MYSSPYSQYMQQTEHYLQPQYQPVFARGLQTIYLGTVGTYPKVYGNYSGKAPPHTGHPEQQGRKAVIEKRTGPCLS